MNLSTLQRAYRGLSDRQTKVLQVLAVNFGNVKIPSLVDIMKACGWDEAPTKSGTFTQSFAKQELQTLINAKLVYSDTRSMVEVSLVTLIRDFVAQQSVLDGTFGVIADAVDLIHRPKSLRPVYYVDNRHNAHDLLRQARTAFYRGDAEAYRSACEKAELQTPAVLSLGLMDPFDARVFAKLPAELQIETLEAGLHRCILTGSGSRDHVKIIGALDGLTASDAFTASEEKPLEMLGNVQVNRLAAAGNLAQLQQIADAGLPSSELASGCLAFLTGRHEAAEKSLDAATKRLAKSCGRTGVILPILPGLMHLLLLLRKSDTASRRRLKQLCNAAGQQWYGGVGVIGELVQSAAAYGQSPTTVAQADIEQRLNALQSSGPPPLVKVIAIYLQKWFRLDLTVDFVGTLEQAAAGYAELGLAWLAALAEDAALASAKSAPAGAEPGQCHEQLGTAPMLGWIDRPPLWMEKLGAIRRLAEGGAAATRSTPTDPGYDERMIWELDVNIKKTYWDANLRPYVQKRSASGWSKGRPVALERLYRVAQSRTPSREFDFLSDQDHDVCKCINAEEVSTGYYRYTETVYNFRTEDALAALVGHPLVFAPGDRAEPLELTMTRPQLVILREGDGFQLLIEPRPIHRDRGMLVRQGPKRYALVQYTKQQLDLADILGSGVTVPPNAEQEVAGIVKSLAPLLEVQADADVDLDTAATADTAVEAVDAQTTPCLHLVPFRQGVRAEFFVRPFGEQGPMFPPGHGGERVFAVIGGKSLAARRDHDAEAKAVAAIRAECPSLSQGADVTALEFPTAEETLELLTELEPLREQGRLIVAWPQGQPLRLAGSADFSNLSIRVKRDRDWFAASGRLALGDQAELELAQLAELISAGSSRFVPLSDGRFLALSERLHRRVAELAAFAERRGEQLRFPPIRAAALDDLDQWCSLTADKHWKQCVNRIREAGDIVAQVPSTLGAELRDYQIDGYRWLCRLAHWGVGACLADDMGLGKTLQAIALLLHRAADGPALVVAPTSVCFNWEQELFRFAPTLTPRLLGPGDRQAMLTDLGSRDVVICSYALMHNEAERLQAVPWHTAILDEAQAIKNTLTKRSRAAMALQADFRLILTGTPIENHLGELWNLFQFINPGLLGSLESFQQQFANPIERDRDREASRRLKRLVQPFLLRRTKTQVLSELPPRTEVTVPVTMSDDEAMLYEAARQRAVRQLSDDAGPAGSRRLKILAEIVRLRRACCHPTLLVPDCGFPGAKLTRFSETIEELMENQHKALVFSQFVDHLKLLREELDRKGISYQYLDGSTPAGERRKRVEAFQNGEGDIFLISLKAGGTGLNLTAADYVLHMDPWWNPAVEDQAADRAHRLGQQRPVTIYRFITRDTIEEKIVALHETKRDLADSLLEGSDAGGRLSAEELLALIR